MANENLVLPNGSPVNIQKKNGVWMFIPAVFGEAASAMPSEMLIVPKDMLPSTIYNNGARGYIPEDQILSYVSSNNFTTQFNAVKNVAGSKSIASAQSIVTSMQNLVSKLDIPARKALYSKTAKTHLPNPVTSDVPTPRSITFPNAGSATASTGTPWDDFSSVLKGLRTPENRDNVHISTDSSGNMVFMMNANDPGIIDVWDGKWQVFSLSDYAQKLESSSPIEVKKLQAILGVKRTGLMTDNLRNTIISLASQATVRNVSIWRNRQADLASQKIWTLADMVSAAKKSGSLSGGGSRTRTDVTKFTSASAEPIVTDMFQQLLGRDPSKDELNQWTQRLNNAASKNPTVTSSTTSGTHTSVTTKAGFGQNEAQMMVRNQLAQTDESRNLIASTTLYDAFLQAIQSPIG